jgi:hypothetical protein
VPPSGPPRTVRAAPRRAMTRLHRAPCR